MVIVSPPDTLMPSTVNVLNDVSFENSLPATTTFIE